jgi:hypothetical protein
MKEVLDHDFLKRGCSRLELSTTILEGKRVADLSPVETFEGFEEVH